MTKPKTCVKGSTNVKKHSRTSGERPYFLKPSFKKLTEKEQEEQQYAEQDMVPVKSHNRRKQ